MLLSQDFFDLFIWNHEVIDGQSMYTIRDKIECRKFWLRFWKEIIVEKFKNQKMVRKLSNIELDRPVMVQEENRNLVHLQPSVQNITHYSDEVPPATYTLPFVLTKLNCIVVVFLYVFISMLCFLWYFITDVCKE